MAGGETLGFCARYLMNTPFQLSLSTEAETLSEDLAGGYQSASHDMNGS